MLSAGCTRHEEGKCHNTDTQSKTTVENTNMAPGLVYNTGDERERSCNIHDGYYPVSRAQEIDADAEIQRLKYVRKIWRKITATELIQIVTKQAK